MDSWGEKNGNQIQRGPTVESIIGEAHIDEIQWATPEGQFIPSYPYQRAMKTVVQLTESETGKESTDPKKI